MRLKYRHEVLLLVCAELALFDHAGEEMIATKAVNGGDVLHGTPFMCIPFVRLENHFIREFVIVVLRPM